MPTMIWFSDLVEPASNFKDFFMREDNKILDVRNVWLLDIRNMGDSDHHGSFDMEEISADVALATGINYMDRCTGVINLEGGPLDHRHHEAY